MTIIYRHLGTPSIEFASHFFGVPTAIDYLSNHESPSFYALNFDFDSGTLFQNLEAFTWSTGLLNIPPDDWQMDVGFVLSNPLAAESPILHSLSHVGGYMNIGPVQSTVQPGRYVLNDPQVATLLVPADGPNSAYEFQILLQPGESLGVVRHIDQDTLTTGAISWLRSASVRDTVYEPAEAPAEPYMPLPAPIQPVSDLNDMIQESIRLAFVSVGMDPPHFPDPEADPDDPDGEVPIPVDDPYTDPFDEDNPDEDDEDFPEPPPHQPEPAPDDPEPEEPLTLVEDPTESPKPPT